MPNQITRFIFCLFCWSTFAVSPQAFASELGLGMGITDEGDDRLKFSLQVHGAYEEETFLRFYFSGRKFGPVTEKTMALSYNWLLEILQFRNFSRLSGSAGLVFNDDYTDINLPGDPLHNISEHNLNLGANLGLHLTLLIVDDFFLGMSYESHIFLAGLAGIFLARGTKHYVSFFFGKAF